MKLNLESVTFLPGYLALTSDLHTLIATEALKQIHAGECTCVELAQSCLKQIERLDPIVHAWVCIEQDRVLEQAKKIDEKISSGADLNSLAGIPVGIKDIFNTCDLPTQMGSPIWQGFQPGNDARVVHNIRKADGIILGKTVTAEFAVHAPGETLNPYHFEHSAGTSSTGSAVAVATQMCPLAVGTQTGGSIIRPASYCGIYGYKPSFGLIPRTAMLKTTDTLDTVGFFARSIQDLAYMFEVLRVHGPDYPISNAALNDKIRQNRGTRPWRVALVKGPKWDFAEPYAQQALNDFALKCQQIPDIEIEEVNDPEGLSDAHAVHTSIYDRTLAYYFKEEFKQQKLVSPILNEIIQRGNRITLQEYNCALEKQNEIAHNIDEFFMDQYDIILNLATGGEAPKGINSSDRQDNCLIWTLCWLPTVNIPVFMGPNKLPYGAQVVARRYNDYLLLDFLRHLETHGLVHDAGMPELCA